MKKQNIEEYYEIEKILDKKIENDQVKYKVKWKGYPLSDATWEPLRNFSGNMEKIEKFEEEIDELKKERDYKERFHNLDINTPKKIMVDFPMSFNTKSNENEKKVQIKREKIERYLSPQRNYSSPKRTNKVNIKREKSPSTYSWRRREKEEEYDDEENEENEENDSEEDSFQDKHHHYSRHHQNKNNYEPFKRKMKEGILGKDKPDRIVSAKRHIDLPSELLCEISWKRRKNNITPLNSFYLNSEIKKYHPMLLVNYYEEHLIFPKRKEKKEHYYR